MSDVRERLRALIRAFVARYNTLDEAALPRFEDGHRLLEEGNLDSVGFVSLLIHLGEETDQELDFSDIDPTRLRTVGEIISLYEGER